MLRLATALASPSGRRARLSVFIFHRVLAVEDPMLPGEPDGARFARLLDWIGAQFQVLEPVRACRLLGEGRLPSRAAVLTFDDGYRDNHDVALPLLLARRLPAAFFIATGFTGGRAMFNDRVIHAVGRTDRAELRFDWLPDRPVPLVDPAARRALAERLITAVKHLPTAEREARVDEIVAEAGADAPPGLMMDEGQLRVLRDRGMTLGGHTRGHPILARMDPAQARAEIVSGRQDLVDMLGIEPLVFAYPNGRRGRDYREDVHRDMVREAGFTFAFATEPGAARQSTDPWQIPRFTPWDRTRFRFQARALSNLLGR